MNILDKINSPEDVRSLEKSALEPLCSEIRGFLIENVSKTGGHLASNLGVVELSVAIHRVFDTRVDRLVFDVGHQSYVHKMLTGRREKFSTLRCLDGLSGFPKPAESIHDAAISGHASNSVSLALGMARARSLQKEDYSVVALIGDGALTGGLAYEGLSNAGTSGEPLVVILNDNGMSIGSNVGSVSEMLAQLRIKPGYFNFKRRYRSIFKKCLPLYNFNHRIKEWIKRHLLPSSIFADMGFQYLGPVDGHDVDQLETVLAWAKELRAPVLVHVLTQKGRGYSYAEENPEAYHGVSSFDTDSGIDLGAHKSFSGAFGAELSKLAEKDEKITAITAAMSSGTGLSDFELKFKDRFFDVGIAEGHAVTMAAGMAKQGLLPVFAVYSSFLQRAYDMLIHDVSLSNLHVVLAVDRAGIVGQDGETHQGVFDLAYLCSVPNMAVFCPASYQELRDMLSLALYRVRGPVAIRYPRGAEGKYTQSAGAEPVSVLRQGDDVTIVSYGTLINEAMSAAECLEQQGISAEVIKINLINPLETNQILESLAKTQRLLTVEEVCSAGSIGSRLLSAVAEGGILLKSCARLDLGDGIIIQGDPAALLARYGLDANSIVKTIIEFFPENQQEGEAAQ